MPQSKYENYSTSDLLNIYEHSIDQDKLAIDEIIRKRQAQHLADTVQTSEDNIEKLKHELISSGWTFFYKYIVPLIFTTLTCLFVVYIIGSVINGTFTVMALLPILMLVIVYFGHVKKYLGLKVVTLYNDFILVSDYSKEEKVYFSDMDWIYEDMPTFNNRMSKIIIKYSMDKSVFNGEIEFIPVNTLFSNWKSPVIERLKKLAG